MNALIAAAFDNEYVDQEIVQDLGSEATESVVQKLNFDEVNISFNDKVLNDVTHRFCVWLN